MATPPDPIPPPALQTSVVGKMMTDEDEEMETLQLLPDGVRSAVVLLIQSKNREVESLKRKLSAIDESNSHQTCEDPQPPTPLSGVREINYLENEIFSLRSENLMLRKSIETQVAKRDDSEVVAGLISTYKTQVTKAFEKIGDMQQHLTSLNKECSDLDQENSALAAMLADRSPAVKKRPPLQSQNKNTMPTRSPSSVNMSAMRSKTSLSCDSSLGKQRHWVFGL